MTSGHKRPGRKRAALLFLAALSVMLIWAFYSGLTVQFYTVQSGKITGGGPIRIVLVSDLHSTVFGSNQQPLIGKILAQDPHLILLAGDIADDQVPILGTELLLAGIRDAAPIYYVTGNHELWSDQTEAILETIASYGVEILSGEYLQTQINGTTLVIAGIDDPAKRTSGWPGYNQVREMEAAFGGLADVEGYKILLAHRPELIGQYAAYPFDLVVSGHAHGGQVRVPLLLNGLYAPNQGWFPRYAGGLYRHGTLVHIVGRGLSVNPRLPRIFNPPELVVITLEN